MLKLPAFLLLIAVPICAASASTPDRQPYLLVADAAGSSPKDAKAPGQASTSSTSGSQKKAAANDSATARKAGTPPRQQKLPPEETAALNQAERKAAPKGGGTKATPERKPAP